MPALSLPKRSSGLVGLVSVALVFALAAISRRATTTRADELDAAQWGAERSQIEGALHSIEHKLRGKTSTLVGDGTQARPLYADVGHEWTAADERHYQDSMADGTGAATAGEHMHLPPSFLPIAEPAMQQQYARNLVEVLRNLKSGYLEEMVQWADKGPTAENSYIAPIVEGIEAPLIKDLDAEAHERVRKTVSEIGARKNLNAHQMKEMRARLLVPLLLRIRARVHHQVEVYTVQMLRRVILGVADSKGGAGGGADTGVVVPASGGDDTRKPTHDMEMEYQLRDIDSLYRKGVISEKDYQAQKAKVLSEWLGQAVKQIGGQAQARKALENFLWPAVMTEHGCKCLFPFKYKVLDLGPEDKTITYNECTDIESRGVAWCAIDPEDEHCMKNHLGYPSKDPTPNNGWTRWDKCMKQPSPMRADVVPTRPVVTKNGCTCKLPFDIYPPELGGLQKVTMNTCTRTLGQEGRSYDWCVVEGNCGYGGLPGHGKGDARLGKTHWDRCVGEPAGFLEPKMTPIKTVKGCECMRTWSYQPESLKDEVLFAGCTDIETPGTAWCAVVGNDCGVDTDDPKAGWGKGKYGWKKWDVCVLQPTAVVADLSKGLLPKPMPYVRTERGCQCQLPWKVSLPETSNRVTTFYTCERFGMHAAWCPTVGDCGIKSDLPLAHNNPDGFGWTHWDKCIGVPPGFLPALKPKIFTQEGCVCKQPWSYRPSELGLQEVVYIGCTDIESPNKAWCAIDVEESPKYCGIKSTDKYAGFGKGKYGWNRYDYCEYSSGWPEGPSTRNEQPASHAAGVVPSVPEKVKTLNGCTCKIPYEFAPPSLDGEKVTMTHCNRYDDDLQDDTDGSGLGSFYWCPVEEEHCGRAGPFGQWDKCVGSPPGYLVPTPVKTVQGCDCLLPFEYEPPILKKLDGPKRFTYAAPTDIHQNSGSHAKFPGTWCPVVGNCGHKSKDRKANSWKGGYGWTHWDVVVEQPEERALLTGVDMAPAQHALPAEVPIVRTQHGCRCKLPFKYQPASTCGVTEEEEDACVSGGGYMMQGWCVTCKEFKYTQCTREDQKSAWCAVEGECGIASTDVNANPEAKDYYGWTHWDNCIGVPAGYQPSPESALSKHEKGASLAETRQHGVSVESVVMKHDHKVVEGPDKAAVDHSLDSARASALQKAILKKKVGIASEVASKHKQGERGRRGEDAQIKALTEQMQKSIKTLNSKIQKLDEPDKSDGAVLRPVFVTLTLLFAAVLALVGLHDI